MHKDVQKGLCIIAVVMEMVWKAFINEAQLCTQLAQELN